MLKILCLCLCGHNAVVCSGDGDGAIAPPLRSDSEFLDNFCTVCVSFLISPSNCKIRAPRFPCFLFVKNCGKTHSSLLLWGQKVIFFWEGAQPLHHTPLSLTPTGHPLLTEILNTPLTQASSEHTTRLNSTRLI